MSCWMNTAPRPCARRSMRLGHRAEALMRAELTDLPDGRWEAEDYLDNDGITDVPLPIKVALEIKGDRMMLDFTGTAPHCAGPVNIALPTAVATAYVAIKHIFPALPANAGVMRPIDVIVSRKGRLLSAEFPAPVGGYTETILRMIDVIFSAVAQAAPDRVVANAYGTINALSIAGKRKNGQPWVMFSFYGGGHGGSLERRRAEPRQCADFHRDDPADGDSRGRLSGDVPQMGAAPGQRGGGRASRRAWARSTRSRCWRKTAPRRFCSANAGALPPRASQVAARRR